MIIEGKKFIFQGFRRVDLSGRPFGFLFIWLGSPKPWRFGIWIDEWRKVLRPKKLRTIGSENSGYYEKRLVPIPRFAK